MYQPYHCCTRSFEEYYSNQGGNGLPYYKGISLQRGSGLGGIFKSMYRMVLPLFKSGARALGKQALKSGIDIANDYVQGKDLKTASEQRAREAAKILTDKASTKVKTMIGGNKRKRVKKKLLIRKKYRKQYTPDIFS